jgi:hypothetical protein
MPVRVNLQIEGLAALQRKLRKEVLLAPPLRSAMNATVEDAARIVVSRAPRASGRMAASVTTRLDKREVPTWGRVSVTARRRSKKYPRGFRYPRMLEYSSKSKHQRWFRNAVIPAKTALARHVEAAKRHIERIWAGA